MSGSTTEILLLRVGLLNALSGGGSWPARVAEHRESRPSGESTSRLTAESRGTE